MCTLSTHQQTCQYCDQVRIHSGAFAGLEAIYQMGDGQARAMVLIEILSKVA